MKKIIVLLILSMPFCSYGQERKVPDETEPHFKAIAIVNRPNGVIDKQLYYQLINPTDREIKVILDPNFLNEDRKFDDLRFKDGIQKKMGQVRITIQDTENNIIPTAYRTNGEIGVYNDPYMNKDPKQFVEKYTQVLKPHSAMEFKTRIPLVDNCIHCMNYLATKFTYFIKLDTVYQLSMQLNTQEFLDTYGKYIENKESYYSKPIESKPFYFKDILRKRDDTHDVDLYLDVTSLYSK